MRIPHQMQYALLNMSYDTYRHLNYVVGEYVSKYLVIMFQTVHPVWRGPSLTPG